MNAVMSVGRLRRRWMSSLMSPSPDAPPNPCRAVQSANDAGPAGDEAVAGAEVEGGAPGEAPQAASRAVARRQASASRWAWMRGLASELLLEHRDPDASLSRDLDRAL